MRTQGKPEVAAPRDPIDSVFAEPLDNGDGDHSRDLATVRAPMQQVRTGYTTAVAVQKPRDLRALTKRVEQEAELCGEDFFYSWTVKSKDGPKIVEGVSIEGAMILVRNFGNAAAESRVAEEGPMHWLLDAAFIDLETGFTLSRQFRQRKSESHQRKQSDDGDRQLDIAFQIGQSKAQRNVIVRAMPEWLVRRAMQKAKEAADNEYAENLPRYIDNCQAVFAKLGVTVAMIETKLGDEKGPKPVAAWTVSDLRVLQGIARGIASRETNVAQEFGVGPAAAGDASPKATPPVENEQPQMARNQVGKPEAMPSKPVAKAEAKTASAKPEAQKPPANAGDAWEPEKPR